MTSKHKHRLQLTRPRDLWPARAGSSWTGGPQIHSGWHTFFDVVECQSHPRGSPVSFLAWWCQQQQQHLEWSQCQGTVNFPGTPRQDPTIASHPRLRDGSSAPNGPNRAALYPSDAYLSEQTTAVEEMCLKGDKFIRLMWESSTPHWQKPPPCSEESTRPRLTGVALTELTRS